MTHKLTGIGMMKKSTPVQTNIETNEVHSVRETYNVIMPQLTIDDLSLDKWRPITFDKFVGALTDAAFYDADIFIEPRSQTFDLANGANAIVWFTCSDIDHDNDDAALMTPELLVLSTIAGEERRYLCFTRT